MVTLNNINKIGIIKLGSIGDVIHTLPALYILRRKFPEAIIDWIVEKKSADILLGNKEIDNIIVIDTKLWRKNPFSSLTIKSILRLRKYFKNSSYDIIFDFQGLIKSGIISFMTGSPMRVGFNSDDCREPMNSIFTNLKSTAVGNKTHVVNKNLNLLRSLGIDVSDFKFPIYMGNGDSQPIDDFFKEKNFSEKDHIVVIDPSAGWVTKCIDSKILAKVSDYLIQNYGCKVIIMWGPDEYEKAITIKEESSCNPEILCKTTLKSLDAFLQRCNLMISPDTGPMHLAAALGVQCIGIYGPSCPYKNGPYGDQNLFVSKFVDCAPCYKRQCDDLKCINTITFEDIKDKIDIALKKTIPGGNHGY